MSDPYKILVCGGRNYTNKQKVFYVLDGICRAGGHVTEEDEYGNCLPQDVVLIHGGATGADLLADLWAVHNYVPVIEFPALWKKHGKAAGPIRNKTMLTDGKPDLVIAFPGGRGTANMIKLAEEAGVFIIIVNDEDKNGTTN